MLHRIQGLRQVLKQEGLDACLIFSDINRNYLTGFTGTSGALLLLPDKALFLTDSRYTLQARRQVQGAEVQQHTRSLLAESLERLKRCRGLKRVGFEAGQVSVAQHQWLLKASKGLSWVPLAGPVESLRLLKDRAEQEALAAAGRVTDRVFHHILPFLKPGAVERDLAAEMEHHMRREGAEGPSFETIVASGWRSALPHGVASSKILAKGDFVVLDFGCRREGYCSDMTRTVCLGRPSPAQRRVYEIVRRAQQAGLEAVRPGRTCGDVDQASRSIIARAGFGPRFGHGTGHGVGREVHENPRVGPKSKDALKPGMAVTVEPGIYLDGRFGVRIEDLVLVTEEGRRDLYRTTKELLIL